MRIGGPVVATPHLVNQISNTIQYNTMQYNKIICNAHMVNQRA